MMQRAVAVPNKGRETLSTGIVDSESVESALFRPNAGKAPAFSRVLYSPNEVAEMTGLGRTFVYQLIASGDMPSVRIGRLVKVTKDSLDDWIRSHAQ